MTVYDIWWLAYDTRTSRHHYSLVLYHVGTTQYDSVTCGNLTHYSSVLVRLCTDLS